MHAFDFAKLAGAEIRVRTAKAGESLKTLDGQMRELTPDMLVIADAERPVAVAGVMGGADSEVTSDTPVIVFESAYFNPLSVRRTSRKLGLKTEASMRFERGADPRLPMTAMERACALLEMTGAGRARGDGRRSPSGARRADDAQAAAREDQGPARRGRSRCRRPPDPRGPRVRASRCGRRLGRDRPDAARGRGARGGSHRRGGEALRVRSPAVHVPGADVGAAADRSAHRAGASSADDHDRRRFFRGDDVRLRRRGRGGAVCARGRPRADREPAVREFRRAAAVRAAQPGRRGRAQPAPRAARRAPVRDRRAFLPRARREPVGRLRMDRRGGHGALERRRARRRFLRHEGRRRADRPGAAPRGAHRAASRELARGRDVPRRS